MALYNSNTDMNILYNAKSVYRATQLFVFFRTFCPRFSKAVKLNSNSTLFTPLELRPLIRYTIKTTVTKCKTERVIMCSLCLV